MKEQLNTLRVEVSNMNAGELIEYLCKKFESKSAFSTSLGAEDQVLTDLLYKHGLKKKLHVELFTLDTGRLHPETYQTLERTNTRYNINIRVYFPLAEQVQALVNQKGLFSFYESVEERKACCAVRKLEPLSRALKGVQLWFTGIRRSQSKSREHMELLEWDDTHQLFKCNPLIHWTDEEVWNYIHEHTLPYNPLHDQGFPSIGCAPCTRAVKKGEDIRSGRWWWEDPSHKECGIHSR